MMHIRDQWAKVSSCAFGFPDSESCELLGRHELRLVVVASGAAFSSASDNSGQEKLRANLSRIPEQYLRRILAQ